VKFIPGIYKEIGTNSKRKLELEVVALNERVKRTEED